MSWRFWVAEWRAGRYPADTLRSGLRLVARHAGQLARDGRLSVDSAAYELRLCALVCGLDDLDRLLEGFE